MKEVLELDKKAGGGGKRPGDAAGSSLDSPMKMLYIGKVASLQPDFDPASEPDGAVLR